MHSSSTQVVPTTTNRKQTLHLRALLWGRSWCDEVGDVLLTGPGGGKVGCSPAALISKHKDTSERNPAASTCVDLTLTAAGADLLQIHFPGALTQGRRYR